MDVFDSLLAFFVFVACAAAAGLLFLRWATAATD